MSAIKIWDDPLDETGDATYTVDYSAEMTRLNDSLSAVTVVPDAIAVAAGLTVLGKVVTATQVSFKFSITPVGLQDFDTDGEVLNVKVTYTTAGGEKDADTYGVLIKFK